MGSFWVSRSLKALWRDWLRAEFPARGRGKLVVATLPQKRALKEWILQEYGGAFGWTIITRAEEERQAGALGTWELNFITKTYLPPHEWPLVERWVRDWGAFARAGVPLEQIPWASRWKKLSSELVAKAKQRGFKFSWEIPWTGEYWIGFDPLERWNLPGSGRVGLGLIAEGELSGPQMTAITQFEKTFGPHSLCDELPPPNRRILQVASMGELGSAIKEILSAETNIERIICSGESAGAAVALIDTEGGGFTGNFGVAWPQTEALKCFVQAQDGGFIGKLEWLRNRAARGDFSVAKLKELEKEAARQWELLGFLQNLKESGEGLPVTAEAKEYAKLTEALLPGVGEGLWNRMRRLEGLFAPVIDRRLWVDLLESPRKAEHRMGGVPVVAFEQAQGLVDGESLVVWTAAPAKSTGGLVEAVALEKFRETYFGEDAVPRTGWLETTEDRKLAARAQGAFLAAHWVGLSGVAAPAGIEWEERRYRPVGSPVEKNGALVEKHRIRRDPKVPFGEYDFALEMPVKVSAKTWEKILTDPESAWYEVLKFSPQWKASAEDPDALWVGNWVHEAMRLCDTPEKVDAFFTAMKSEKGGLLWQHARARAWSVARVFACVLANSAAQTRAVEKDVRGLCCISGVEIPISGRIDRIVKIGGVQVVLDFKTSPNAKPIGKKALAQEGDGLQLWLYARLLWATEADSKNAPLGVCRLPPKGRPEVQMLLTDEALESERRLAQIAKNGILGRSMRAHGRFGGRQRLPIASFGVENRVVLAKQEARDA